MPELRADQVQEVAVQILETGDGSVRLHFIQLTEELTGRVQGSRGSIHPYEQEVLKHWIAQQCSRI